MKIRSILAILVALQFFSGKGHAVEVVQVIAPKSGIKVWLVEDHHLPIVAMHFSFKGGSEQDPVDKQGLENLTVDLLTEGAGSYNAASFQKQLADHSIGLGLTAGRDEILGGVKCLTTDQAKAFELLHLALTKPLFADKDIERLRAHQSAMIRQQYGDPSWQARFALFSHIFAGHPYSERHLGTAQTLSFINRDDIVDFAVKHLARDNLVIGAAGDIDPDALATIIDEVFGDLPAHAQLAPVLDAVEVTDQQTLLVKREGTQTEIMFAMPGPKRSDPEWYAADIANYILGGGGFSSRLMQDVRDKKGLTYGIDTDLAPADHSGLILGQSGIDNPKVAEALSTIHDTLQHFRDNGVTTHEISAAKDYLTGSKPLSLTSTDKIATMLVAMQREDLGSYYLDRYSDIIRQVSSKDIARAIDHWFDPDKMTWILVGHPEGVSTNQVKDMVRQ